MIENVVKSMLVAVLIGSMLSSITSVIFIRKEQKSEKFKHWPYVLSLSFVSLIFGVLLGFAFVSTNIESFNFGETTIGFTVVTALIAAGSLFVAISTLYKNSRFNKDTHDIQFAMKLIENNHSMFKEERQALNSIMTELTEFYKKDLDILEQNILNIASYYKNNKHSIDESLIKQERIIRSKKIDSVFTEKKKNGILTDLKNFQKFSNDSIEKLVITNMKYHRSDVYSNLPELKQNKINIFLNNSNNNIKELEPILNIFEGIFDFKKENYTYDEIFTTCNQIFNEKYDDTGAFLRHSYRIIKFINLKIENVNMQKELRGILRAQFSEKVMLGIFYNSVFTSKGLGFGIQLLNKDFFGDPNDLENNDSVHFNDNSFILSNDFERKLIKHFFTSKSITEFSDEKTFRKELKSVCDKK